MLIAKPQIFNLNDRIRSRGLSRDPVGGTAVQIQQTDAQGLPVSVSQQRERGFTYPITVTSSSKMFFDIDFDRKMFTIVNNDLAGIVWVFFGGAGGPVGQGMRAGPGGGGFLLDNHVPTSRIWMIGTVASNPNVSVTVG